MARQRAGQARAAFARVGTASVGELPASDSAGPDVSILASGKGADLAVTEAGTSDGTNASAGADEMAGRTGGRHAVRKAGRKAGKKGRRVGRPRGPERAPLTVRILASTNERLTAAVDATGDSPQYIVDAALSEHLSRLGF